MTVSFADQFDIAQFSKKYSVILKGRQCPRSWRNLQVAVYQLFNRNRSCGFYNSENA